MNYRYLRAWRDSGPVARAITRLCPWSRPTCRVGGFWPGIYEPIPEGEAGGDLAALCRAEAAALWAKYDKLAVLWSGGVDSSLLACLLAESRPSNATLVLIAEAATLANDAYDLRDWLLAQGCTTQILSSQALRDVTARGGMVVTGYHADTLLSGDIVRYNDLYESIWGMTEQELFERITGLPASVVMGLLADLEPLLAMMPLPRTAANVAWWLDFNCAWASDDMTLKYSFDLAPPGQGYVNFFGAPSLQLWSMQGADNKIGPDKASHKHLYLDLIAGIVGFAPSIPHSTEPGAFFGESMDMGRVLAIREDWSVVESPSE